MHLRRALQSESGGTLIEAMPPLGDFYDFWRANVNRLRRYPMRSERNKERSIRPVTGNPRSRW